MKTLKISEDILENWLSQWPFPMRPEYRFSKCWSCGDPLYFGCWHIFFRQNQREAHICRKCGKPFEVEI